MPGPQSTALGRYQSAYLKALRDSKYAAEQRLSIQNQVTTSRDTIAELNNKYEKSVSEKKRLADLIAKLEARRVGGETGLDTQITNAKNQLKNEEANSQRYFSILNQEKAQQQERENYLAKLSTFTATPTKGLIKGKGGNNGPNTGGNKGGSTNPAEYKYKYNAPMVKWSYFNAREGVPISVDFIKSQSNLPEKIENARQSFKLAATRGAIQQSPEAAQFHRTRMKSKDKKLRAIDNSNYGFRFHYNPTGISMSYGITADISYEQLQTGRDDVNPIVPLGQGGWTIELYLNRMEDMVYLNENGSIRNGLDSTDVYPEPVPQAERKKIYDRGTMYDLEYLFKAVNGAGMDYSSELRGETSDIGWIAGLPVEFHMGDGMRYLGQISAVNINHAVFNERMVPMLTTVSITARRFYDLPINKGNRS